MPDVLAGSTSYMRLIILLVFGCLLLQVEYLLILAPIKKNYLANKKSYWAQLNSLGRLRSENRQYLRALRTKHDLEKCLHPNLDHNTLMLRLIKSSTCDFNSVRRVKSGFQFSGHGEYEAAIVLLKKLESIHAFLQSIVFKKMQLNEAPAIYLQVHAD